MFFRVILIYRNILLLLLLLLLFMINPTKKVSIRIKKTYAEFEHKTLRLTRALKL